MKKKQSVFIQVHGTGICQCQSTCEWCQRGFLCLDSTGHFSWDRSCKKKTNRAVVATRRGRMVGVLKYNVRGGLLSSTDTYVTPLMRQTGLATYLWKMALRYDQPDRVLVRVVSDRGITLVKRLARRFRHLNWYVRERGGRKLRRLK
jgi:hypothetical protein